MVNWQYKQANVILQSNETEARTNEVMHLLIYNIIININVSQDPLKKNYLEIYTYTYLSNNRIFQSKYAVSSKITKQK